MESNRGKVSAIIVGDVHATDRQPLCRTDDFKETQMDKGSWLSGLWVKHNQPPVIYTGDLFDAWKASPWTISMVLEHFPPGIVIPGNHDLPYHGLCMYGNSALHTVEAAGIGWRVLTGKDNRGWEIIGFDGPSISIDAMPWGVKDPIRSIIKADRRILLAHVEITDGSNMPGWESGGDFLKRFPEYDLIATGHNHHPFIVVNPSTRGKLVNCGSLTRQSASETHWPQVYLWDAESNNIQVVRVPCNLNAVSRDHIESKEAVDSMIASFIERVRENAEGDIEEVDFRANVEKALWELEEDERNRIKERITWALKKDD